MEGRRGKEGGREEGKLKEVAACPSEMCLCESNITLHSLPEEILLYLLQMTWAGKAGKCHPPWEERMMEAVKCLWGGWLYFSGGWRSMKILYAELCKTWKKKEKAAKRRKVTGKTQC